MIKLNNSYLGFTDGKKAMQGGKIEKSLDMLIQFDNDNKIAKSKEFTLFKLQEGLKPEIEENYSYYSPRKEEYTKPKTLYKLSYEDGSFHEINKTLYNFALYVLENGFTDESTVKAFIEKETKEKEEKERLEQERIQKEEEEKRNQKEKEDQERKKVWDEKRKLWREKGSQFMSDEVVSLIHKTIEENTNKYDIEATPEELENFTSDIINRMPEMLGNQSFIISTLQYHVEEGHERDCFHPMTIEAEILMSVFDVTLNDKNITITSKVKAKFEGREYKGSQSA